MEKLSVKDRILIFSQETNQIKSELARKMGCHPSNLMPSATKSSFSSEKIVKFLVAFPEVSAEWLLRGEGEMLRRNSEGVTVGDVNNYADNNSTASVVLNLERQNAELLRSKDETIAALREVIDMQRTQIDGLKNKN